MEDINNYLEHLGTVRDSLTVIENKENEYNDNTLRDNAAKVKQAREEHLLNATRDLNNKLSAVKDLSGPLDQKVQASYVKLKAKANDLSEAKYKFKTLIGQSEVVVTKKAEKFDEKLDELEDHIRKKKNLKDAVLKLESELISSRFSNRFIELDIEVKNFSDTAHNSKVNEICKQKNELLGLITDRLDHIEASNQRIKNYIKKVYRLQLDSGLNLKFPPGSENIDNFKADLENELARRIEERDQIRDKLIMILNIDPEELAVPLGPDGYLFLIEEITVDITDKESIRTEMLEKLRKLMFINIRLR